MHTSSIPDADRDQVLAFRLNNHHLATRLPPGSLLEAAAACGVQNTPPGSGALSLYARVSGLKPVDIQQALEVDKTLLQMWSQRGAPHLFPTRDAAIFTTGLLPGDEPALRYFILGIEPALPLLGMSASEVVERTVLAAHEVLDRRVLANKQQLDRELAGWIAERLPAAQTSPWQSPSLYAANQTLGEAMVSFALRPVSLRGVVCFAARRRNEASFARTDQWLETPWPQVAREQAQAELARRYLHCYGPSTVQHFAEWAGIAPEQATQTWRLVENELLEINFGGRKTWLLAQDLSGLGSASTPEGVRFLPPHDPYLQLRDRATLVPDKTLQRRVWRQAGNPGVVLANGRLVAIWRSQKRGNRLCVAVENCAPILHGVFDQIEAEATTLAPYKDCTGVEVKFSDFRPA